MSKLTVSAIKNICLTLIALVVFLMHCISNKTFERLNFTPWCLREDSLTKAVEQLILFSLVFDECYFKKNNKIRTYKVRVRIVRIV